MAHSFQECKFCGCSYDSRIADIADMCDKCAAMMEDRERFEWEKLKNKIARYEYLRNKFEPNFIVDIGKLL